MKEPNWAYWDLTGLKNVPLTEPQAPADGSLAAAFRFVGVAAANLENSQAKN